jgi:dipeptidyl-peptidase-4
VSEAASFPRRFARSQRFTLGRPRSFTVAPDGSRVAFLRSNAGDDPVNRLFVLDLAAGSPPVAGGSGGLNSEAGAHATGGHLEPSGSPPVSSERLVADPVALLGGGGEELPAAERARRERSRERAGGIVAYATDAALRTAAFALAGRLFTVDLAAGGSGGLKSEAGTTVAGGNPQPSGSPPVDRGSGGLKSEAGTTVAGGHAEPSGSPPADQGRPA